MKNWIDIVSGETKSSHTMRLASIDVAVCGLYL